MGSVFRVVSGPLSNLIHVLMTVKGSVEGLPDYGAGLWNVETVSEGGTQRIAALVDAAMENVDGGWDRYKRTVYLNREGQPIIEVTIWVGDNAYTENVPLRRP